MSDKFISRESAETDLLDCAAFLAERIKSSDGHAEAMAVVIPLYLERGNVDLAAELANAVDDPHSRDRYLTFVAVKCAEIDDDEYALQLAEAVEDDGLRSQTFERLGLVKAAKNEREKALEIASSMTHADFVYAGVAVNDAANGNMAKADEAIDMIEFATARVAAFHQIASARLAAKDTEGAIEFLRKAADASSDIEHNEEQIRALLDIANQYLQIGSNDLAIETFDIAREQAEVLDNMHRDFFLVNCALGYLYAGNMELADSTLDLVNDKTQLASALLGFAREFWKRDEKEEAIDTIDEAHAIVDSQSDREIRDSRARYSLLASIAAQYAGFGKTDRGIEIALQNPDHTQQTAALTEIARVLTLQKEDELARQTVEMIPEDSDRLSALVGMADEKEKLEEMEASAALLDETVQLAETVPQMSARSAVLTEIAARFASKGMIEKAKLTSLENLKVIAAIRDESNQAISLANMSVIYDAVPLKTDASELEAITTLSRKVEF